MFFNFVFMFLWSLIPPAKVEIKDTEKSPAGTSDRGHFYFGARGHSKNGRRGQPHLVSGVNRAWVFHIASNPNSEWIQAGIDEKTYVDFMMGRSGDTIKTSKRTVKRDEEKGQFYSNLANSSATAQWGEIQAAKNKVQNAAGNNPVKTLAPTTGTPNTPSPGSQDAYASHYDKSAARPTVVNINIGELAHFDRTAIASSSQERDIMAAVEEKVAESIYRLSITAFNNIGGYNMA